MSIVADATTRVLRSRFAAALATPHGVDRYLELVNPMWAANEVRARIVDITREVDVPGHPPVATITLQPTSTWRGHRAGQHVQLGVEVNGARRTTRVFTVSSPDSKPGDRFTITMRANPDGVVSRYLVEQAEVGTMVHLSQAQGEFVLPDQRARPHRVHHRWLRHHAGDVDAALLAASHPPRSGHVPALRAEPRSPDLRDGARGDPPFRLWHRRAPAAPRARRPGALAGVPRAPGARLPRPPDLGLRPGAVDQRRARGVRRLRRAARGVLQGPGGQQRDRRRATSRSPAPAQPPPTPAPPCSSRPRPPGSPRRSAAGWASASPAPPRRRRARSATC